MELEYKEPRVFQLAGKGASAFASKLLIGDTAARVSKSERKANLRRDRQRLHESPNIVIHESRRCNQIM
jgi:hypothetical protein